MKEQFNATAINKKLLDDMVKASFKAMEMALSVDPLAPMIRVMVYTVLEASKSASSFKIK